MGQNQQGTGDDQIFRGQDGCRVTGVCYLRIVLQVLQRVTEVSDQLFEYS